MSSKQKIDYLAGLLNVDAPGQNQSFPRVIVQSH